MSLVFAGVCSHAPGITGRADRAEPDLKDGLYASFDRMRDAIKEAEAETLVVVAAEHFANFFMDNMPAYCIGMADDYQGPIEDEKWLGIKRRTIPGNPDLSHRLIKDIMQDVDVSYAQEWKFDHGIMVPLHFLTPDNDMDIIPVNINCQGRRLRPCTEHGRLVERSAVPSMRRQKKLLWLVQGRFHWPATPDSGKINEPWDQSFLEKWAANDKDAMLAYSDEECYAEGGQGAFEIRTFIAIAAACEGNPGDVWFYAPIPIYAVGCTVGAMAVS